MDIVDKSFQNNVGKLISPLSDKQLAELMDFLVLVPSHPELEPTELQKEIIDNIIGWDNWLNFLHDEHNDPYIRKDNGFIRDTYSKLNKMLLIESHFRFKKTIKRKKPTLDLTAQEKRDLKMVMESLERENSNKMLDQSVDDLV